MPQFAPSEAKTAIAQIVAKPSGMNCEAELFLGPDDATKVVSSGRVTFVSTGEAKNVSLPITMPTAPGTYHGYIDVLAGGLRFLAYKLTEDVVIAAPAALAFTFGVPTVAIVPSISAPSARTANFSCVVTNNNSQSVTRTLYEMVMIQNGVSSERGPAVTVTLSPGQSYTFSLQGNYQGTDGGWYIYFMIPWSGGWIKLWLRDDLGNTSQVLGPYS